MNKYVVPFIMFMTGLFFMACPVPVHNPPAPTPVTTPTSADLASLTLSTGTLVPAFDAASINYTANVPFSASSITVSGTKADSSANLVITPSVQPMSLNIGSNTVTLLVTPISGTSKTYTVTITRASLLTMVTVPAGIFQRDATVSNTSSVSSFKMSQTEITRDQFTALGLVDTSNAVYSTGVTDPVQRANWYHALVFCNKLSIAENLTPVYSISGSTDPALWGTVPAVSNATWNAVIANWSANGYRLPTEMEWQWAAMGATSGLGDHTGGIFTNGYLKEFAGDPNPSSSGDSPTSYVWYNQATTTIGNSLAGNEIGIIGLSGNVWEWCWDLFDVIPTGGLNDYQGAASGTDRVMHGGGWDDPSVTSPAFRNHNSPEIRYISFGFRVVSQ